jgi:hypothetical protein
VFVQRGMVYFFLRKNMFWRIELALEAGAVEWRRDYAKEIKEKGRVF